jgi:NitT/TauT family transport system substrate-binding protein
VLFGNREFVGDYPVATKRFLRAILKATDLCATEPERAAQGLIDGGFTPRYGYALQTLTETAYDRWRESTQRTRCGSSPCASTRWT